MLRRLAKPMPLLVILGIFSVVPILSCAVWLVQLALDAVPPEGLRLLAARQAMGVHAAAGLVFGLTGPLQFLRVLRARLGLVHRLAGWLFALAGYGLGLSGLALLAGVVSRATPVLDLARGVFGLWLVLALTIALAAALRRDIPRHRAWMIRTYATGMGAGSVAPVFFPIHLATGLPVTSPLVDLIILACWALTIALAERIARLSPPKEVLP